MINDVDQVNISPDVLAILNTLPGRPTIDNLNWRPPEQTTPITVGTMNDRLKIFANSDIHEWTEYMIAAPHPNADAIAVMAYWDGQPEASYTLTAQSYWVLVPGSYTQVNGGNTYKNSFTCTNGITTTDSSTLTAELGVDIKGLSAKLSSAFSHTVSNSSTVSQTKEYDVGSPPVGNIRVWMLWQLCDQIVALDGSGKIIDNPTRRANVNWSDHAAGGGAYVNYTNLQQIFPSDIVVPVQADFPLS